MKYIFFTKETYSMKCEYYIEAESKEKAQQKFDAGEWEDCHEDFVATVDQTLTKIEVQE